jgi:hypothetical protein
MGKKKEIFRISSLGPPIIHNHDHGSRQKEQQQEQPKKRAGSRTTTSTTTTRSEKKKNNKAPNGTGDHNSLPFHSPVHPSVKRSSPPFFLLLPRDSEK